MFKHSFYKKREFLALKLAVHQFSNFLFEDVIKINDLTL